MNRSVCSSALSRAPHLTLVAPLLHSVLVGGWVPCCSPQSETFPPQPPLPSLHLSCSAASCAGPVPGWPRIQPRSPASRACSFPTCSWLLDYAGSGENSPYRSPHCGLPVRSTRSRIAFFEALFPAPRWLCLRFTRLLPAPAARLGSLLLSCRALSSPNAPRFIPTIALLYTRGSVTERYERPPG